jgi:hypothetical protein
MAYTKYSLTPANNTAAPPDGAPEGMLPSAVNDTMRDMMAQIRDVGDGIRDGTYTMTAPKITGGTITGATFTGNTFSNPIITGVSTFAAGTVSAPAITTTGDTNTGIFFPAADTIAFTEGGVESMRIDSSGNVGIGTSSPATLLHLASSSVDPEIRLVRTPGSGNIQSIKADLNDLSFTSGRNLLYNAGGSERMRINSSGNVGIGTTTITSSAGWSPRLVLAGTDTALIVKGGSGQENSFGASGGLYIDCLGNSTGTNNNIIFRNTASNSSYSATERMRINSNGTVSIGNTSATYTLDVSGSIRASTYFYASGGNAGDGIYLANGSSNGLISQMSNGSASTTTYIGNQTITTSSDIRIKNNIRPTERNALELLEQWEIVDHNWNDPSDQCENNRNSRGVWTGVIAQQIQPITPWLVNKPLEDENKDGSKNLWLVDFAYSVPLLVKAIQEQQAMIEELKTRIETLENK